MQLPTVLLFLAGLVLLLAGAEWLVRGASRLASAAGVSPLVVGLTVVAFGTGTPEMAVSVQSALSGAAEIAYGNVAVAFACLPVFLNGYRIARWEGLLFLAYYGAYLAYILLDATGHEALPAFNSVMALFVIPLTVVTLGVVTVRSMRLRGKESA